MRKVIIMGGRWHGKSHVMRLLLELHKIHVIERENMGKAEKQMLLIGSGLGHSTVDIDSFCQDARPELEKKQSWHEINKRHISKKQRRKL